MDNDLALLHAKVDRLTEMMEAQHHRLEQVEDLGREVLPLANQALKVATGELTDIGNDFRPDDVVVLLKRGLRDIRLLTDLLGYVEGAAELVEEVLPLSQQMLREAMALTEQLETKGYLGLARGSLAVADQVAANYSEADLRALAEAMPALLGAVRQATRPELLKLANAAVAAVSAPPEPMSLWQLVSALFDAKMRQGLGRMLRLVKVMGA